MKSHLPLVVALLAGALTGSNAFGQAIYRCGNVYSQSPCPGGTTVEANDSRTPAQKAQADANAAEAANQADRMEKDRLRQEQGRNAKPVGKPLQAVPAAKQGKAADAPKSSAKRKKKGPEYFTASATPNAGKNKKVTEKPDGKQAEKSDKPVKP